MMDHGSEGKRRIEIELPVPLPTWNRILAMHFQARKNLRHLLHQFVLLSIAHGSDWPMWTTYQGKRVSTELLKLVYLQMIRPSKSRKSDIVKLRAELKPPKL